MQVNVSCMILVVLALVLCGTSHKTYAQQSPARRSVGPADSSNPLKELIPGEDFQSPEVRAQQDDEFDNPAYPFVEAGEKLWSIADGSAGKSCQSCHDISKDAAVIKAAVASYPKFIPEEKQVVTLGRRVNLCREKHMKAKAWDPTSTEWMAMQTYLRSLARGLASTVDISGSNKAAFERGKALYETKIGRLQISCAQCHTQSYGLRYGKDILSQGHPLAYPVFNSTDRKLISLHERFQMCNRLARAEPQSQEAPDYTALELYISWRSKNLPFTAPGVRP